MSYEKILAHALKNGLNVLLRGRHGVGKTAIIRQVMEDAGLVKNETWKYYSASTMDPWVDFIGVPREVKDDKGNTYLDLVRPRELASDQIVAIFFDELNRSHKKIRNAIMELIQFKSINGKQFPNLKVIFAAINPDDDEQAAYDVEKLDPAQLDRFQVQIDVPYKPDAAFFKKKFAKKGEHAVKWWSEQSKEVKDAVSPRRLEYALDMIECGGDVRHVFPNKANVGEFMSAIQKGDPTEMLNDLCSKNADEVRRVLLDSNTLKHVKKTLMADERLIRALAPHMPEEELLNEMQVKSNAKPNETLLRTISGNVQRFEFLTDSILSNKAAYADVVTRAFELHRQRKNEREKEALANSRKILSMSQNAKVQSDETIMVDGKSIKVNEITPNNFEQHFGRRFRMTAIQATRVSAGQMTREEALAEYLKGLIQTTPES